jgi:transposase
VATTLSELSVVVVEDVTDVVDAVLVTARTRDEPVPCPVYGTPTAKVNGYHGRTVADVPTDGRQVVVCLRHRHTPWCSDCSPWQTRCTRRLARRPRTRAVARRGLVLGDTVRCWSVPSAD